mmetsp:Transcript_43856/g.74566  ORF Transcript_43856/g.74566 Transcript_43856/m.74566 type:complete len:204 (+) Transcript_43856:130-741(+)
MPCIATCGQGWRGGCSLVTRVEAKQLCGHLRRDRQSRLRWRRVRQSRHRQRRRHRIRTRVAGADHPRRRLLPEACPREGSVPAPRFPGTASARAWRFPTQTPWPPNLPPTRRTLPPSKRQRRAPQPQPGWRERKKPHYSTTTTTMTRRVTSRTSGNLVLGWIPNSISPPFAATKSPAVPTHRRLVGSHIFDVDVELHFLIDFP